VRPTLPPAALLAVWGTAALDGRTSPDEAVDHVAPGAAPLRFGGLPGEGVVGLTLALGRLRALGATGLRLVLPAPGDAAGLPGPTAFVEEAVACRAAVVSVGEVSIGLLPGIRNAWQAHPVLPATRGDLPLLAEADRALQETLRLSVEDLLRLDVARWRPEVATAVAGIRDGAGPEASLPPGLPNRAHRVLALALRVGAIVELAAADPGGAVSAAEMASRAAALAPLATASRRALVAACNAVLEPTPLDRFPRRRLA
jgi:hypothetical protein